ncbi:efflux RND transporter periplasmic adaptor subunit [Polaribacter pacificus]|nr:efflux RND transporter periplasmic adaptor subunit [Polaribacter pacificus]
MLRSPFFMLFVLYFLIVSCTNTTQTTTPEVKNITESVYASGFIKSKNQYKVYGIGSGIVKKVFVTEGMRVKKGDPIFQMDDENLKIATKNAQLTSIANDYKTNTAKLTDAKKAVELANRKLLNDSLQYQRQKNLWNNKIGSRVEFEQKELAYENSKIELHRLSTNYEDLKRQLKLVSEQSKNNLEIAKLKEDDYIIRSQVDGVVYKLNKEEGELINMQEPSAIIGTDMFLIELSIDELDIVKVKKGQTIIIRMDSYSSEVFEAQIIAINPMMNSRTRSFQADAIFTKSPKTLFPNLTVEANIIINTKQAVLTIPRNYLINDSFVALKGGKLQKIETGLMDYDLVEIKSGIDKNTVIELQQ